MGPVFNRSGRARKAVRSPDPRARFGSRTGGGGGRSRVHAGFSLLEVLLAVALASLLLVAVNFFILGMGELWGNGAEARLFDRHVRGVSRFLENLVQQAVVPVKDPTRPATDASPAAFSAPRRNRAPAAVPGVPPASERPFPGLARIAGERVVMAVRAAVVSELWRRFGGPAHGASVQGGPPAGPGRPPRDAGAGRPPAANVPRPRGAEGSQGALAEETEPRFRIGNPAAYEGVPPMLLFEVDEAPGQCVWPQRPLPRVECGLQVNADEGLVLLWKSKLEEDYGKGRPRKTQLSPFARAISFDYYDAERNVWTHADQPQADGQGGWLVPQRVRVLFVYHGIEREVSIALPDAPEGAPLR